jgi:hypothetical protein
MHTTLDTNDVMPQIYEAGILLAPDRVPAWRPFALVIHLHGIRLSWAQPARLPACCMVSEQRRAVAARGVLGTADLG